MKKLIGLIVFMLLLVGCSEDTPVAEEEIEATPVEEEVEETPEEPEEIEEDPVEEEVVEEQPEEVDTPIEKDETEEDSEISNAVLEELVFQNLEDNFGTGSIDFHKESKVYSVFVEDAQFALEIIQVIDGDRPISEWEDVVESFSTLSETMTELLGPGYTIALKNPMNEENIILACQDGTVLLDYVSMEVNSN